MSFDSSLAPNLSEQDVFCLIAVSAIVMSSDTSELTGLGKSKSSEPSFFKSPVAINRFFGGRILCGIRRGHPKVLKVIFSLRRGVDCDEICGSDVMKKKAHVGENELDR